MKYLKVTGRFGVILNYKNFLVTKDDTLLCLDDHKPGQNTILEKVPAGNWIQAEVRAPEKKKPKTMNSFGKLLVPSKELSVIVGNKRISRVEVIKRLWSYIKSHNLQDQENMRSINVGSNELTKAIFKRERISMFEMSKFVNEHLKD